MSNTIERQDVDTTKQKQPEEIRVEVVQEEDSEEIVNMLKEYFFKVNCCAVLIQSFAKAVCIWKMNRKMFVFLLK